MTILLCAPQSKLGEFGSMPMFLKEINEKLVGSNRKIVIVDREFVRNNTKWIGFVPWIFRYWMSAFVYLLFNDCTRIVVVSQEYILPFFLSYQVVYFHDLIQYFIPRNKFSYIYYRFYLRVLAPKLYQVLCPSLATGRMLKKILKRNSWLVCGVPVHIDSNVRSENEKSIVSVWVGTLAGHKKFEDYCKWVKVNKFDGKNIAILPPAQKNSAIDITKILGLNDKIQIYSNVSNELLIEIYSHSKYVVSTSRIEGFCMPILEGAAYGCIPVVRNNAVFREIYGDLAVYLSGDFVLKRDGKVIDVEKIMGLVSMENLKFDSTILSTYCDL
jgi:glycosyltransferase involved in cell wall biosynthesis